MQRFIALLGGINVGGHRVKMDVLRELFEALGFTNVATFIASGNVIFEWPTNDPQHLQALIEPHLKQSLGYTVPTFIRSSQELAAVAHYQPFPKAESDTTTDTLSVMFLRHTLPDDAQHQLLTFSTPIDEFHVHNREIYWLCHKKTTESLVDWPRLGKSIALPALTVRNVNTIRKLAAKYLN